MKSKYLTLIFILIFITSCSPENQTEFILGDTVLIYNEVHELSNTADVMMVDVYARSYKMQFLDPATQSPFSGTIVDDEDYYRGRFSLIDGYMKELITYYEDGSPSYFATYSRGEIIIMNSWYRDGSLRSRLEGGEHFVYSYFDANGKQTMHIENNLQTEYFENGKIKNQIPFDASKLYHGTATAYHPDGTMKAELVYHSGKLISMKESNSTL